MKRFAVIDLGTNTFHLLISSKNTDGTLIDIYRERIYVRLGEEGMEQIGRAAFRRAEEALKKFSQVISLFEAIDVKAFATAAFRSAKNSGLLKERAKRNYGIEIEIISGEEEARLIYEGIKLSGTIQQPQNVIMDIGGGSVEFIFADENKIQWCASFPIGVSVLKNKFHFNEPITKDEIFRLKRFIHDELQVVFERMNSTKTKVLIGSSGTFDVLGVALGNDQKLGMSSVLDIQECLDFGNHIIALTEEQRRHYPSIPESRADLIVVALILLETVFTANPNFELVAVCPYALKEGAIHEMIKTAPVI